MAIGCLQTEANNYKPNTTLPRRGNPERLAIANTPDSRHLLHRRGALPPQSRMQTVLGQFQRTVNLPDAQETSREVVRLQVCMRSHKGQRLNRLGRRAWVANDRRTGRSVFQPRACAEFSSIHGRPIGCSTLALLPLDERESSHGILARYTEPCSPG
jgi:hypothetical protein